MTFETTADNEKARYQRYAAICSGIARRRRGSVQQRAQNDF